MDKIVSLLMVLVMYLSNLMTAIPAFVENVKKKPDQSWTINAGNIQEVDYDTYYNYYQENYTPKPTFGTTAGLKDVTAKYQELMDKNIKIAANWREFPTAGQIDFYNAVKDFGEWDYKRYDAHKDIAAEWGLNPYENFTVYGVVMDWEVLGNINFASTGAAVGFTPTTIRTGGGIVNIKNGNAKWEEIEFYYDEEYDSKWITFGIGLYQLCDPDYTEQVKLLDSFLDIVDPRIVGFVYKIYLEKIKPVA